MSSPKNQGSGKATSGPTGRPTPAAKTVRSISLLLLVGVVFIVAVSIVISSIGFVLHPDPNVKAGAMYVTLTLSTGCALLMLVMAFNASYFPLISRRRAPDVYLVLAAMGITGVVTGLLTVGNDFTSYATRLVLGAMALTFVIIQNTRLEKAQQSGVFPQAGKPGPGQRPLTGPQPTKSRQRRGGRKR